MKSQASNTASDKLRRRRTLDTPWMGREDRWRPAAALFASPERVWPMLLQGLLMALLFYIPNTAQIPIETGIRGLNVANVLFILALISLWMIPPNPSEPAPLKVPMLLFVGVLGWALLVALAGDASNWIEDVTYYKNAIFYILLYFLFFHAVRDMQTVRVLVLLILFLMFTSSVLGVRQAFDYGVGNFNENKRVAAPFGWSVFNANRAAVFMVINLQLVLAVALFMKSSRWLRLACAGIFFMGVFAIFHSYSRQVYFILAVLLLLIALRKHLMIAVLATVALYNYQLWVPETVVARIEMTQVDPFEIKTFRPQAPVFDSAVIRGPLYGDLSEYRTVQPFATAPRRAQGAEEHDRQYDESTESRFTLWAGAGEMILQRPGGIGFNRFKREISAYVPAELAGKDAHNYYVLLTTEAGIFAPLVLLVLLASLLLMGQRLAKLSDDEECRTLGIGFVMATLAVMMGNIYGSRFVDGDVMSTYWVMAALVARTLYLKRAEMRQRLSAAAPKPTSIAAAPVAALQGAPATSAAAESIAQSGAAQPHRGPLPKGPSRFF